MVFAARVQIDECSSISSVVQECHREHNAYESEEVLVVGLADAVVEPATVVVEAAHTTVAGAAVFGVVVDVGLAHFAEELVLGVIECLPKRMLCDK